MTIEVKVPVLPESVSDATIATWHKKAGDAVKRDENLVDLETDKVVLEVPSPVDGVLKEIKFEAGATVTSQQVIAVIEEGAAAAAAPGEGRSAGRSADRPPLAAAAAAPAAAAPSAAPAAAQPANCRRARASPPPRERHRSVAGRRHRPRRRGDQGRPRQLCQRQGRAAPSPRPARVRKSACR